MIIALYTAPGSKPLLTLLLVASGCFFFGMATATAQKNVLESDPISARKLLVYDMYGGYAGASFNSQGGTFTSNCDCEFTGGAGAGFAAGLMFEKLTRSRIQWGAMLGYEGRSIEGRFRETEGVLQQAPSTGQSYVVPIEFLNVGTLSLHYVTATPYIKYTLFNALFVRGGVSLSYVFSNNLSHVKSLESDSVRFPNGETAAVSIPGYPSGEVVLQDEPVPDLKVFQIGVAAAVGLEIRMSKKFFVSPVLQYVFPITTLSSAGEGYSVRAFQLLVEGRVIL